MQVRNFRLFVLSVFKADDISSPSKQEIIAICKKAQLWQIGSILHFLQVKLSCFYPLVLSDFV